MAASPSLNLPPGCIFRPKGRELVRHYLFPKALGRHVIPGFVAEGVDVFSAVPDALPFDSRHRRGNGEVWGYFYGAWPVGEEAPVGGGCWFPYGCEKVYRGAWNGGEVLAFRRRLQYFFVLYQQDAHDGAGLWPYWASTPWLMTEFRLNKGAAAFRCAGPGPGPANMDYVVRKVFTKPAVPPLPLPLPLPLPYPGAADESTGSNHPGADNEAS
jgi:hypothetical protein